MIEINRQLREVVETMAHLSRVREVGHFDRLAAFSGVKDGDGLIPASGAFSVWSHLAGWFLTGKPTFKERLLNEQNNQYFDHDAQPHITKLSKGESSTLVEIITRSPNESADKLKELAQKAAKTITTFFHVHFGAVIKHASGLLDQPSPSDPEIANRESIRRATN